MCVSITRRLLPDHTTDEQGVVSEYDGLQSGVTVVAIWTKTAAARCMQVPAPKAPGCGWAAPYTLVVRPRAARSGARAAAAGNADGQHGMKRTRRGVR